MVNFNSQIEYFRIRLCPYNCISRTRILRFDLHSRLQFLFFIHFCLISAKIQHRKIYNRKKKRNWKPSRTGLKKENHLPNYTALFNPSYFSVNLSSEFSMNRTTIGQPWRILLYSYTARERLPWNIIVFIAHKSSVFKKLTQQEYRNFSQLCFISNWKTPLKWLVSRVQVTTRGQNSSNTRIHFFPVSAGYGRLPSNKINKQMRYYRIYQRFASMFDHT